MPDACACTCMRLQLQMHEHEYWFEAINAAAAPFKGSVRNNTALTVHPVNQTFAVLSPLMEGSS